MSFLVAAIWSISALFALDLITSVLVLARPLAEADLVSHVLCQGVAFMGALFFLVLLHERERPLSDVLALRRPPVGLCLLALGLGVALQGPLTFISDAIYTRYPLPEQDLAALAELFNVSSPYRKVALVVAVGVFGPVVEEMFFRGGIFGSLRRRHGAGLTLLGVSLLFAAAHRDVRLFFPDLLGGLAMGYVRAMSGSLWPALVLHTAFNSTGAVLAVRAGPESDVFSRPQMGAAMLVTLVLLGIYRTVALRSELCASAREQDAR
jgi:membrane protease YdiL (CAAX protease family)